MWYRLFTCVQWSSVTWRSCPLRSVWWTLTLPPWETPRQNKLDEALNALPHCPVTTLPLLLNYAGYPWPYREDVVTKVGGAYVTVKHAIRAHYPSTDATSFRRAVEGVLAVSVLQERLRDSEGSQASFRQLKHFVELNRHNPLSQRHHSLTRRLSKYLRTIKGVPMEDWSPEAGDTPAEEPTDFCALVKSPERLDALSLANKEKLLKHLEMTFGPDAWSKHERRCILRGSHAVCAHHRTGSSPTAPATKEPKEEEEELPLEMVMPAADPPTPPAPPAPKPTIEEDLPDVFNQLLDDFKENQSATAARNQAKSPRRTSSTVSGFGIPRAEETPSEPAKRPPTPTNTGEQTGNKITGGLFSFTPADGGESYKRTERLPSSSFKGKTDGYAKRPVTYNNTLKSGFGGQFDVPPPTGFGRKTLTSITSNYGENPIGGLASDIIAASTSQRKTASQSWKNNDNVSTEALRLLLNSEAGKALLRGIINE
ncbi:hypothetical protein ADEAN_000238900 [Angomonas deanei]|uniref:Uncharacterized protein n=1 Tax=Angomonas deanei TaxID=59799 RepID=A0A7G2C5C0_9TRYP|nr:hypothetical protein ADEAN_000238900 [Angomonas deanei]